MQPIDFSGATEIKKPASMTDEECFSVWAVIHKDEGGNVAGFTTKWMPSYEDLQALNRGEGVCVYFPGPRLAPMCLFTIDQDGNNNDAG